MAIFYELTLRIERRIIGAINPKGYLFKLKPAEKEALLAIRNDFNWDKSNHTTLLLKQNI